VNYRKITMKNEVPKFEVVTVTLNPAIDRTITISNFTAGAVNRVEQERSNAGGKGVNVASALADYGHQIAVTGFLGRENSSSFEALFAQKKIADCFVRIAGRTRVGIKITDPALHQTTDINFPGPAPAPEGLDSLREQLATLDGTWFVITGSLPPGVNATLYRDIVLAVKARGRKVVLDTSGEALRHALEARPNIIKPNIQELEALVGKPLRAQTEVIAAAKNLIARGIELVTVSMGKDGACFVTTTGLVIARPPEIKVKSTVGAGDAMVAGIIAAHLRGLPLAECARLATAFSIDALTRFESGITSPAAIDSSMDQVAIEEAAGDSQLPVSGVG
jgi:1-phosphofructokinase